MMERGSPSALGFSFDIIAGVSSTCGETSYC